MLRCALVLFSMALWGCGSGSIAPASATSSTPPLRASSTDLTLAVPPPPSTATAVVPPGLPARPEVPGALARFGSMTLRLGDERAPLFAFDDGRVWAIERKKIRDLRADQIVMSLEDCLSADIFASGEQIACLKRSPMRIELLSIPDGKLVSTVALGIADAKRRSVLDFPTETLEITSNGGLVAIVGERRVTLSPAPHVVRLIDAAPSPFSSLGSGALAGGTTSAASHTLAPRRRGRSPSGKVVAEVDPSTHAVSVRVNGEVESPTDWAPAASPIGGGFLAGGGFYLWYGRSWEELDARGRLVANQGRETAKHFMLTPLAHSTDDALLGTQSNDRQYTYRRLSREEALFTAGRCLSEVPGTSLVVCSVLRKDASSQRGAEGDVVLFDAITGKESARRSLGTSHLTSAYASRDGTIVLDLSGGKLERVDGKTLAPVASIDALLAKHKKKLGHIVAALPNDALMLRSPREVWVIEGDQLRVLVRTEGDHVQGVDVSPNGKEVAVVVAMASGSELRLVDIASGSVRKTFSAPLGSYVGVVAYDRTGERIMTASQGVVWIWDAKP